MKLEVIQLEFDFSILKNRTIVQVTGYDCFKYRDLTGCVGVVDGYCDATGEYLIYFKDKIGLIPNSKLILPFKRNQLKVLPGRGRCSWDKYLSIKKR